ncbi:hypothetical protein [Absidia glauca]|uniref:Ndc10 domain-containing protein n=1 Tax=Absidia glauca TaxID=4829 RepID=A0A163K6T2_ABSGL|nr:hypothetical protein [Absidia glauca]
MKIKPPRQAQEWRYFSHRESVGKALSSPGIRFNKNTHISCGSSARIAELSPGDPIQPTVAENAFVQVIMMFRKTFIQDSVLMMELHPCYPIWQHSIFSDPAYLSFKRDMLQIEAQEHDPALTHLQQCVPMHYRFQAPIGHKIIFFGLSHYNAPSSPRHYFFASIVILFTPRRQTNERTSNRTNERLIGYDDDDGNRDDDDANDDPTTALCRPKRHF